MSTQPPRDDHAGSPAGNPPRRRLDDADPLGAASETPVTVDELTDDHIGWYIKVIDNELYVGSHRCFELAGIRKWTNDDGPQVGLIDKNNGELHRAILGTERRYSPDTECELLRQVRKPRRQRRTGGVR